jgi:hypothetical protein
MRLRRLAAVVDKSLKLLVRSSLRWLAAATCKSLEQHDTAVQPWLRCGSPHTPLGAPRRLLGGAAGVLRQCAMARGNVLPDESLRTSRVAVPDDGGTLWLALYNKDGIVDAVTLLSVRAVALWNTPTEAVPPRLR